MDRKQKPPGRSCPFSPVINGMALLCVRGVRAFFLVPGDVLYRLEADESPCLTKPFSEDGSVFNTSPMLVRNVATWSKYCHISLHMGNKHGCYVGDCYKEDYSFEVRLDAPDENLSLAVAKYTDTKNLANGLLRSATIKSSLMMSSNSSTENTV